jgi:hypothetical protein
MDSQNPPDHHRLARPGDDRGQGTGIRRRPGFRRCGAAATWADGSVAKPRQHEFIHPARRINCGHVHGRDQPFRHQVHHELTGVQDVARGVLEAPSGAAIIPSATVGGADPMTLKKL